MSPGRMRDPSPDALRKLRDATRITAPPATAGHGTTPQTASAETIGAKTVLIPRDPGRAAPLTAAVRAAGGQALIAPATRTVSCAQQLGAAVRALVVGEFTWVVLTSVNAVDALAEAARLTDADLRATRVRWAVVGPATRAALAGLGIAADLEPSTHSANGLIAAFAAISTEEERGAVLLPQSDLAAPTLADGLRQLGFDPHVGTAYRTIAANLPDAVRSAWDAGDVDIVVLTSPSIAREVARQLGVRVGTGCVAVGQTTAEAARDLGFAVAATARAAETRALLDAICQAVNPVETTNPTAG